MADLTPSIPFHPPSYLAVMKRLIAGPSLTMGRATAWNAGTNATAGAAARHGCRHARLPASRFPCIADVYATARNSADHGSYALTTPY